MKFLFYGKNDPLQETISSIHASDIIEATEMFAAVKRLSVPQFLKIYKVRKDENKAGNQKSISKPS